jgi:hypothetical protein
MEFVGNTIDVSRLTTPDFRADFWFPGGMIGQCKSVPAAESLVAVSTNNPYAASGQYFDDLLVAQAELLEVRKKSQEQLQHYIAYLQSVSGLDVPQISSTLSFEELVRFLDEQALFPYTPPIGILNFIVQDQRLQHLLRSVHARVVLIVRKKIAQTVPRFCAVSWARRLWFLMHGSRPPRTSAFHCQVLACA